MNTTITNVTIDSLGQMLGNLDTQQTDTAIRMIREFGAAAFYDGTQYVHVEMSGESFNVTPGRLNEGDWFVVV